jgi:hypothetical protein
MSRLSNQIGQQRLELIKERLAWMVKHAGGQISCLSEILLVIVAELEKEAF